MLDTGAVEAIFNGDTSGSPRVQLLDVKLIPPKQGGPSGPSRYRLVISDGRHFMQAMLSTAQNHIMETEQVKAYSVVQLQQFICNVIHNRKVIIALNMIPIQHMDGPIGQPQKLDEADAPGTGRPSIADNNGGYAPPGGPGGHAPRAQQDGYGAPQQHWQQSTTSYAQPAVPVYQQHQSPHGGAQDPYHQQSRPPPYNQQQPPPKRQQTSPPQYNQCQAQRQNQYAQYAQHGGGPPQQINHDYGQSAWQQQPQHQPYGHAPHQPHYTGQGAIQRDSNSSYTPIGTLTPYVNRWKIKGRVLNKSKRNYSNARGDGKLFNIEVVDRTGEIKITGFNEQCDAFFDRITVGRCYAISGGQLKGVDKRYNKLSHPFEITLNRGCTIEESEDTDDIPKQQFNFVPLDRVEMMQDDAHADVLAIISQCDEPLTYTNKAGREVTKRVMHLADMSGKSIEATLFGDSANDARLGVDQVIAIKGAKVGSWNTKSLTLWGDCHYEMNADTPEAHELMGWWRQKGCSMPRQHISVSGGGGAGGREYPRIHFSDIEERAMGMNGTPEYFSVSCFVTHIKTDKNLWYIACPVCKKKLQSANETNLEGHCEKCDKSVMGTRRWIFSGQCNDVTGSRYINFFDDTAMKLLDSKSADELAPLKEENPVAFDGHFRRHSFQRVMMKCQVRSDNYNDEQRLKVSCQAFAPLNTVEEGMRLLQEIRTMRF